MRKCNVCGRRFRLLAKNRYEVVKNPVGLNCLTQGTVYYNAFDCPHCGCQNIVGILEKAKVKDCENEPTPEWIGKRCEDCGNERCKKRGTLPKGYDCALWQAESEGEDADSN